MADRPDAFIGTCRRTTIATLAPCSFMASPTTSAARGFRGGRECSVLEVACGTGIVTRRLLARLRGQGSLVATDLNEAMLAHGRREIAARPGLEWRQADATALPFPDGSFDAVVCQFGLMFFPDKAPAFARRFAC